MKIRRMYLAWRAVLCGETFEYTKEGIRLEKLLPKRPTIFGSSFTLSVHFHHIIVLKMQTNIYISKQRQQQKKRTGVQISFGIKTRSKRF